MNIFLAKVDQQNNLKLTKNIDKRSSLLRYVVYDNKKTTASITKEIKFIHDFKKLHLLRFEEDKIDFKITSKGIYDE